MTIQTAERKFHLTSLALIVAASMMPTINAAEKLDEILVTTQKREESLQDVPVSVSAMNYEKIESAGIQRFEDVAQYVPNFAITKDPIGDKINIRGIQSGNQAGFEQSVGTFLDGIYRGRGTQARFAFMDVEMVEVLRGPQGTLFGKNTVAGALNITSAKPTTEFEGAISLGYNSEFDETEVQGHISGPLSETLRGRVFFLNREMDEGWIKNTFYDDDSPQNDESAVRLSLEWDVSETTMVSFKTESADFETVGQPWEMINAASLTAFGVEDDIDYTTFMGATDPVLDFGSNGYMEGSFDETVITVEHGFENGNTLTVIGGYSAYEFDRLLDADFNPLSAVRFDEREDFDQTSVEIRIASDTDGDFTYMTGIFLQDQSLYASGLTYFGVQTLVPILMGGCQNGISAMSGGTLGYSDIAVLGDAVSTAANVAAAIGSGFGQGASLANACGQAAAFDPVLNVLGITGVNRFAQLDQENETMAVFFQGSWDVSDDLSMTLGLRYTEEEKSASQSVWAADYADGNGVQSTNPYVIGPAQGIGEFTNHSFSPSDPGMTRDESSLTWSTNIQWDVSQDTMAYFSASTGFKAGGFNSFYMGTSSEDAGFEEEDVITFEVGSKMTVLDGTGEINVAIFRSEFDDLQASVFTGSTVFTVQNAAKAVSQGIEIDSRWALTDDLTITASLGLVDFEFEEFPNQACTAEQFVDARQTAYEQGLAESNVAAAFQAMIFNNGSCSSAGVNNLAGQTSENTPEVQVAIGANYYVPLGDSYELVFNLDINYQDEVYRQSDLDPFSLVDASTNINLSTVFGPNSGDWNLALIVKNLTDEENITYVNDTPLFTGARQAAVGAPRSVMLRGTYRF